MFETGPLIMAIIAVLFIGLAKAGFGGGLGMLTTPLCVLAFGPRDAIGILLPLLCAADAFSVYHYWGKWEKKNLKFLLPGVLIGVVVGVQLIDQFSPREFNIAFGAENFLLRELKHHERHREHADGDVQFARGKLVDELHTHDHTDHHAGQEKRQILFLPLAPVVVDRKSVGGAEQRQERCPTGAAANSLVVAPYARLAGEKFGDGAQHAALGI